MIESVKPGNSTGYTADSKTYTAQGQEQTDASYSVDLSSLKDGKKLTPDQVAALKKSADAANESLRLLVEKLLMKQGGISAAALQQSSGMTPEDAQKAISEDGDWGVNAVSDRIVSFAIAVSGNDTSKLAELKAAINKGFEKAGAALGGSLPGICGDTYNAVMQKLDQWANSGSVDTQA